MIWVLALIMIFIIVFRKIWFRTNCKFKRNYSDINGMGYCTKEDKSIKMIVLLKEKYYYALSHNEEIEITENEF